MANIDDVWPPAEVTIPLDKFEPSGEEDDPTARRLTGLLVKIEVPHGRGWVAGMLHLEMLAVERDEDGILEPVIYPENYEACHVIGGDDGEFQTFGPINGREYILYATPYQD